MRPTPIVRRRRAAALLLASAILLPTVAAATAAAQEGAPPLAAGTPVAGAASETYTGGRSGPAGATASTPAPRKGEPLTVQTTAVGRNAAEPTLGVDKDGVAFYAAGAFDALQAVGNPVGLARTEVLRSKDGGATWQSVQPKLPTGTTLPPTTLDPYVLVDKDTGRVFNPELYGGCSYLQYSDDKGESWQTNPAACGEYVNDHQTIATGVRPAGTLLPAPLDPKFPKYLYYCFNRVADSDCGRSIDGGRTFLPTATPAYTGVDPAAGGFCGGLHGHAETDSKGRLFVPKGHCGFPWVATSSDAGDTWTRVQVSKTVSAASAHLSLAADAADNLYLTWWDAQQRLPYLAVSKDSGKTWGEAIMIAPPGVQEVNFPVLTAGDAGRIAIQFPGTTDGARSAGRPWNGYVVVSTNATDAEPVFTSTTVNDTADPLHRGNCGPGRCAGMFDFLDIVVAPKDGAFWAAATDTCLPTNGCTTDRTKAANGAAGLAVRQLSGPRLVEPVRGNGPAIAPLAGAAVVPAVGLLLAGLLPLRRRETA